MLRMGLMMISVESYDLKSSIGFEVKKMTWEFGMWTLDSNVWSGSFCFHQELQTGFPLIDII